MHTFNACQNKAEAIWKNGVWLFCAQNELIARGVWFKQEYNPSNLRVSKSRSKSKIKLLILFIVQTKNMSLQVGFLYKSKFVNKFKIQLFPTNSLIVKYRLSFLILLWARLATKKKQFRYSRYICLNIYPNFKKKKRRMNHANFCHFEIFVTLKFFLFWIFCHFEIFFWIFVIFVILKFFSFWILVLPL